MKKLLKCTAALGALSLALGAGLAHARVNTVGEDERTHLSGGLFDAGSASSNMELEHTVPPIDAFFDERALFAPARFMAEMMAAREAAERGEEATPPAFTPLAMANTDSAFQAITSSWAIITAFWSTTLPVMLPNWSAPWSAPAVRVM